MSPDGLRLEIRNLGVSLGGSAILNDCTFDAKAGEFIVIAGPNGAGKSTLLRAFAGLTPCTGSIVCGGEDLLRLPAPRRARIAGYLPQNGAVHWPMRVRDIVALGRIPFGVTLQRMSPADGALVDQALADCAASDLAERPATALSGGELSRVLLARMLASDTPLLLADEPAASLDPAHRIAVMDLLARKAAAGKLVIAVSHDIALAARHATRMIVLDRGRIAGDGAPSDLLDSGVLQRIFGVRFHRFESDTGTAIAVMPGP